MRHANPRAVTVVLSANPDMAKATSAILRQADEVLLKPVRPMPLIETIRERLARRDTAPRLRTIEAVATVLERGRGAISRAWLDRMNESGGLKAVRLTLEQESEWLPDALNQIVYRLRYPQPLGLMTLFSMASLQHGARRRRQGFAAPVLVEEARALQVVLFEAVESHLDRIDLGQLPATLMAIADEINAQLLQSISGYENEKPAGFPYPDR
jgi:CheY-like chemotaxis protein